MGSLTAGTTAVTAASNVQGGAWSASLASLYSAEAVPQVWKTWVKRYGNLSLMTDFLTIAGQTGVCKSRTLTTLEEGAFKRYITLAKPSAYTYGVDTGAAGASITIKPATTDFDSNSANGLLRLYDVIEIPGAYQTANEPRLYWVSAVGSGTDGTYGVEYTCIPLSNSGAAGTLTQAQIGTAVPVGTKIAIVTRAEIIGSSATRGITVGSYSRTHSTQIFRERVQFEGGQQAIQRYADDMQGVDWDSQLGRAILYAKRNMDITKDGAMFFGEKNTNTSNLVGTSVAGGSNAVPTWTGVRSALELYSGVQNYSTAYTFDDLYDIKDMLLAAGVHGQDVLFGVGPNLYRQMEKAGLEQIQQFSKTDLVQKFEDLGIIFKRFIANGIGFLFKGFDTLGDPQRYGADTSLSSFGFIIPMDLVNVKGRVDGVEGTLKMNHLSLLNFNNNSEDRGLIIANVAGLNGLGYPAVTGDDVTNIYMLSEQMLVPVQFDQCIKVEKAA